MAMGARHQLAAYGLPAGGSASRIKTFGVSPQGARAYPATVSLTRITV
jgi:hypothetical protein